MTIRPKFPLSDWDLLPRDEYFRLPATVDIHPEERLSVSTEFINYYRNMTELPVEIEEGITGEIERVRGVEGAEIEWAEEFPFEAQAAADVESIATGRVTGQFIK